MTNYCSQKQQQSPTRLFLNIEAFSGFSGCAVLVYSEHFLCQALKISMAHCHKNMGDLSVSTLSNTTIHFKQYFQLVNRITDKDPF